MGGAGAPALASPACSRAAGALSGSGGARGAGPPEGFSASGQSESSRPPGLPAEGVTPNPSPAAGSAARVQRASSGAQGAGAQSRRRRASRASRAGRLRGPAGNLAGAPERPARPRSGSRRRSQAREARAGLRGEARPPPRAVTCRRPRPAPGRAARHFRPGRKPRWPRSCGGDFRVGRDRCRRPAETRRAAGFAVTAPAPCPGGGSPWAAPPGPQRPPSCPWRPGSWPPPGAARGLEQADLGGAARSVRATQSSGWGRGKPPLWLAGRPCLREKSGAGSDLRGPGLCPSRSHLGRPGRRSRLAVAPDAPVGRAGSVGLRFSSAWGGAGARSSP